MIDDEAEIIESESLRPDRRATRGSSAITGHRTIESFMRATGTAEVQLPKIPAREAHQAMLRAWEEKYGAVER